MMFGASHLLHRLRHLTLVNAYSANFAKLPNLVHLNVSTPSCITLAHLPSKLESLKLEGVGSIIINYNQPYASPLNTITSLTMGMSRFAIDTSLCAVPFSLSFPALRHAKVKLPCDILTEQEYRSSGYRRLWKAIIDSSHLSALDITIPSKKLTFMRVMGPTSVTSLRVHSSTQVFVKQLFEGNAPLPLLRHLNVWLPATFEFEPSTMIVPQRLTSLVIGGRGHVNNNITRLLKSLLKCSHLKRLSIKITGTKLNSLPLLSITNLTLLTIPKTIAESERCHLQRLMQINQPFAKVCYLK